MGNGSVPCVTCRGVAPMGGGTRTAPLSWAVHRFNVLLAGDLVPIWVLIGG